MEKITLDFLNLSTLLPMISLIAGALFILCADMINKNLSRSFFVITSTLFMFISSGFVLAFNANSRGLFDVMLVDGLSLLSQIIILVASILFVPLNLSKIKFHEQTFGEYYALQLFATAGFLFMVSTDNLILIFIGLETASLALYTLIAMKNEKRAIEAALKYFTMGALAAGFFVFGCMIIYALTGSIELNTIIDLHHKDEFQMYAILGACTFVLATLGFKLSIIPFHAWTPDVYEGSSAPLAGFMSIVPKIAAFVVAIRFFELFQSLNIVWVEHILYALVVLTMSVANLMALVQEDVKRMLAYSSISHSGFVLAGVMIGTSQSVSALFLYWILFMFANIGAFTMLFMAKNKNTIWDKRYSHPYSKFSGMISLAPISGVVMVVFMLSLAGIPPFSVFWGKIAIMGSAINAGYTTLAIIMAINSAVALYYYLKLIIYILLKEPVLKSGELYCENMTKPLIGVASICVVLSVSAILFIEQIVILIGKYLA